MIFEKIKNKINPDKQSKLKIVLFIVILIGLFVGNIWARSFTDDVSIILVEQIEHWNKVLMDIFSFIGRINSALLWVSIIPILLLNFSNIFKLLVFHCVLYIAIALCCLLKLVYRHEMLFILAERRDKFLEPSDCSFGWASISTQSVITASIGYTVMLSIIKDSWYSYVKLLCWVLISIFILFYNFCIFTYKLYTISDLIFSTIIGILIFSFFKFVLKKDFNKSFDMRLLISNSRVFYWFFNVSVTLITISLYYLNEFIIVDSREIHLNAISHTNCYFEYPDNINLSLDSLILLALFLSNLGAAAGIYLDHRILKNDENKWGFFNFNNDENELDSIYTFSDAMRNAQWNNTPIKQTLIRIAISTVIIVSCYSPVYFVPYNAENYLIMLCFKYFVPFLLQSFCFFFFLKFIFIKLNLVNTTALNNTSSFHSKTSSFMILDEIEKEKLSG